MGPLKKSLSNASAASSTLRAPATPVVPSGPGGPIEIVFTFDTTGSMYSCLTQVRAKISETIQRLFADIPNLRIAVFAHGDYCDKSNYVTKYVDFTNDAAKLCDFVKKVKATGGGDWEECYELVLRQARELLSWRLGSQRALVMIGDAIPHPATDPQNVDNIDWKEEANKLRDEMGVRVYAVQAYESAPAKSFWEDLAKLTYGKHLNLEQFDTIVDMMMAICYREHGAEFFEAYEREVRAREGPGIRKEFDRMFDALRDGEGTSSSSVTPATPTALVKPMSTAGLPKRPVKAIGPRTTVFKKTKKTTAARKLLKKAVKESAFTDDVKYTLGKQYRETVPNTSNMFNSLGWSKWCPAMAPTAEGSTESWVPRRHGHFGVRNTSLFERDMNTPAVYELAVQVKDGQRKHPVCVRTCQNNTHKGYWDSYLLRNKFVNDKVSDVLQKGCKLFVRRAEVSGSVTCDGQVAESFKELRGLMKRTYAYAWTRNGSSRGPRRVEKNGIVISE